MVAIMVALATLVAAAIAEFGGFLHRITQKPEPPPPQEPPTADEPVAVPTGPTAKSPGKKKKPPAQD